MDAFLFLYIMLRTAPQEYFFRLTAVNLQGAYAERAEHRVLKVSQ